MPSSRWIFWTLDKPSFPCDVGTSVLYQRVSNNKIKRLGESARLDVVLCPADGEPPTVRSASGATAAVRAGRWSAADVDALLAELGLSALDFQDTR